jgi:hypothetical protein
VSEQASIRILVSPELLRDWVTRDERGNRLRVTLGEPDAEGFYTPLITVDVADNVAAAERDRILAAVESIHPDGEPCVCVAAALELIRSGSLVLNRVHYDANAEALT